MFAAGVLHFLCNWFSVLYWLVSNVSFDSSTISSFLSDFFCFLISSGYYCFPFIPLTIIVPDSEFGYNLINEIKSIDSMINIIIGDFSNIFNIYQLIQQQSNDGTCAIIGYSQTHTQYNTTQKIHQLSINEIVSLKL